MRRIVALAAGATVVALATGGCGGLDLDAEELRTTQSFPLTGTDLKIMSSLGGVRVLPGTGGAVEVERWVRGKAADDAAWSLRDGTLRLSANCNMVFGDCGARYHVKVPPGVRLSIDAADGVILKDLTQDVDVSTRDRIQVSGTTGRLRLLSEGPITGDGLKSANVRCRTSDGAINLSFAGAPTDLDLQSREGRVTATVPSGSYAVTARSKEGSERSEIKNDSKATSTIVARSTSGDVRILAR
ncbi:DUF4097 family beta strand repeat-containing protein [Nonomuraea basaltis]|uniref:DUF4097 family beta strand repeat-containing protein n=1 Tax=Nonomuraea basaltis TaxID=2495887 RepID=UPI00110C6184|nr:DUF4097 family beta strand repeat-containing protein [Nonomuraea basaltis]TMR93251.1 DUF4097 domain-containing protein [Nonomuraea basaltis]